jgi:archaellum component FlaC
MANPTTIFNFTVELDKIFALVEGISQNYVTTARFNQILESLGGQEKIITDAVAQFTALDERLNNLETLIEVTIQGLKGVANYQTQVEEIDLLNQIAGNVSQTRAISIGLDLSSLTTVPQAVPSKPGP